MQERAVEHAAVRHDLCCPCLPAAAALLPSRRPRSDAAQAPEPGVYRPEARAGRHVCVSGGGRHAPVWNASAHLGHPTPKLDTRRQPRWRQLGRCCSRQL